MRRTGAGRPAAPGLRFRRRRRRGRVHAAAQRSALSTRSSSCRGRSAARPTRDLSVELFGKKLSMPVMIGPTGLSGLFWPDGERCARARRGRRRHRLSASATARSARSRSLPRPASRRAGCRCSSTDRGLTRELIERAAGGRLRRAGAHHRQPAHRQPRARHPQRLHHPAALRRRRARRMAIKAAVAVAHAQGHRRITFGNYVRAGEAADIRHAGAADARRILDPSMSWRDVDELRRNLEGAADPEGRAASGGGAEAASITASTASSSRTTAAASSTAPPARSKRCRRSSMPSAGAFRCSSTAGSGAASTSCKALALGANACLIGRPQLWGLAVAGEAGVAHVLEIYRREIDRAMGFWA